MRTCGLVSGIRSGPERHNGGGGGAGCDVDGSEKADNLRRRRRRDWPAAVLTAVRLLQLAYFAGLYLSLHRLRRSSYFWDDRPWQRSADLRRHAWRLVRWARMQASVLLTYHAGALVVPWMLRLLRPTRRPFAGLAAVFADGWALMGLLNILVMVDSAHEEYCHGSPRGGVDFDLRDAFSSGGRTACESLDLVFGLGGLVMCAEVEGLGDDVEQGVAQRPLRAELLPPPAAPHREHSPPPSYHSAVVTEASPDQQDYEAGASTHSPRGRSSMETTSSLGIERYGYLVSDGWRAPEQPPSYSSRPPSLHRAAI
ncbi:hypothetical protein VTH06DRAFT_7094 [Thermothelomyces fergusii]